MKKYVYGIAMLALCVAGTSCSSHDLYDENLIEQNKQNTTVGQYNDAFVKKYGAIKTGHKWGFNHQRSNTRAAATTNYANYELPSEIKNNVGKSFDKTFNPAQVPAAGPLQQVAFESYFVQHVFKQTNFGDGGTGSSSQHQKMAQLQAWNYQTEEWEDVTNFVGGKNVHKMTDDTNYKMTKGCTLMVNMGTPNTDHPQFQWVDKDGNFICDNYLIKEIDGAYYLGLGYVNKDNDPETTNDDKYDGWIVKLIKAEAVPDFKDRGRIMCEDLGEIGDFDFNDIVFDATIMNDGSINIEIHAAGGTLNATVAGRAVTLGTLTNTGVNWADTQKFTIPASEAVEKGWTTLLSIPIIITAKDGHTYELEAREGQAPGKICTYIGVEWADEYVDINLAYQGFSTWVKDEQPETWWQSHWNETYTDLDLTNN